MDVLTCRWCSVSAAFVLLILHTGLCFLTHLSFVIHCNSTSPYKDRNIHTALLSNIHSCCQDKSVSKNGSNVTFNLATSGNWPLVSCGAVKLIITCYVWKPASCVPPVSGGGPSSVSVSEETAVSLLVSWVPPNAHVLQYRVLYTALTGAGSPDSTVSGL